jgi:hypothetical protein
MQKNGLDGLNKTICNLQLQTVLLKPSKTGSGRFGQNRPEFIIIF